MGGVFRQSAVSGSPGVAVDARGRATAAKTRGLRGYSLPAPLGWRGAGLGNEVVAWAKAFIAAQEFGLTCLAPPWGLNPRGYHADFGTSRFDWVRHRALRTTLPTIRITDTMLRETGEWDYALALRALRPKLVAPRLGPVVLLHETLSGGYRGIARARPFLLREFLRPAHVVRDLYAIEGVTDPAKLTIAVHVRAGDFTAGTEGPGPGEFNKRIPADWYQAVVRGFERHFRGRATFLVFTDEPLHDAAQALLRIPGATLPPERQRPLLSDALAMAGADALVCSVSAFSMLAAFLSDAPYVWHAPNLTDHAGWLSLWGHEAAQKGPHGLTARNLAAARSGATSIAVRGVAVGHDGELPAPTVATLEHRLMLKDRERDLLHYGVIPGSARHPAVA